jgi:hypothetical protein
MAPRRSGDGDWAAKIYGFDWTGGLLKTAEMYEVF